MGQVFFLPVSTSEQTSTLRQRKDRAPPSRDHMIPLRDDVMPGQGGQPSRGSACGGGGGGGGPPRRHVHDSIWPSRRRRARPKNYALNIKAVN